MSEGLERRGAASHAGRGLLAAGLGALTLTAAGETALRTGRPVLLGWTAIGLGAALLAPGAWPLPVAPGGRGPVSRERCGLLLAGVALTLALDSLLVSRLAGGIEPEGSALLWAAISSILLATAVAAREVTTIAPRWEAARWPRSPTVIGVTVAILVAAAATRFPALGTVPRGIYPDEGDMAALSMQILNHTDDTGLFGFGWYYLGMPYFRLMAWFMSLTGPTVAGARLLSAVSGFLTVPVVLSLTARHFGLRAGLLAGALLAVLGPALHFSRMVTNAAPTALLWAIAAAFLLEAARRGVAWAWAAAGIAGGLALYFYPSGRLWGIQAAVLVVALLAFGPRGTRIRTASGAAIAALAAYLVMSPFLLRNLESPFGELSLRYQETTIFRPENAARLGYWRPEWGLPRFLAVQLDRSLGLFDRIPDQNSFWPTGEPILGAVLAALTLLGLGAVALRPRDPRLLLLTTWFVTGFVGMVVTVETPNFHRMAAAVPLLAVIPALVLDESARRLTSFLGRRLAGGLTVAAVVLLGSREVTFYLTHLEAEPWQAGVREGEIVASHPGAWVVGLGRFSHAVFSGWVRLLAPDANRAGLLSPGRHLPPRVPANRDLVFLVHAEQQYYLPLLEELLPGGRRVTERRDPPEQRFMRYEVPREAWRASLRAPGPPRGLSATFVLPRRFTARRLDASIAFGSLSAEFRTLRPFRAEWEGTLHVPRAGDYRMALVTACLAELWLDGRRVLATPPGGERTETGLTLTEGPHGVRLRCVVVDPGAIDWTWTPPGGPESIVPPSALTPRDTIVTDDPRIAGRAFTLVW